MVKNGYPSQKTTTKGFQASIQGLTVVFGKPLGKELHNYLSKSKVESLSCKNQSFWLFIWRTCT